MTFRCVCGSLVLERSKAEGQVKQGSDGVPLWCVLCRNSIGKFVLGEVTWDTRVNSYLTVIKWGKKVHGACWKTATGERAKALLTAPVTWERRRSFPAPILPLRRTAKKCNYFSQCLKETSPQSAPSSLCTIILGHDQVLGTLSLYRDHMFRSLPKPALQLCFSTCHVLQHYSSLGSLSWVVCPSTQQSKVRIWAQPRVSVGFRLAEKPVSVAVPSCLLQCVLPNVSFAPRCRVHIPACGHINTYLRAGSLLPKNSA